MHGTRAILGNKPLENLSNAEGLDRLKLLKKEIKELEQYCHRHQKKDESLANR
jgi:hypothetical protein